MGKDELWLNQKDIVEFVIHRTVAANEATPADRARAARLLGHWAFKAVAWDGHWWGTQPVKSPRPLNSVAWEGTPPALAALAKALGDADKEVRLAAAQAFTDFVMPVDAAAAQPAAKAAASPDEARAALRGRLAVESEPAVKRALIEALGVQKDAGAMEVFTKIALDDATEPALRDAAISALVNIGGNAARQTVARLINSPLSPAALRIVIRTVGELKVAEAAPALVTALQHENADCREAAAKALGALGIKSWPTSAVDALLSRIAEVAPGKLAEPESKVAATIIETLGNARVKEAQPRLIALVEKGKFKRETMEALAKMPDESALPVFVEALRDKDGGIRRNAIKALKTMREKALPAVETLLASGRVPEELVPEIRNAFESGALVQWKMIGPFENVWGAVHPPEKDVLASPGAALEPLLAKRYTNAEGQQVGWRDVTADPETGRVNLERVFKTQCDGLRLRTAGDRVGRSCTGEAFPRRG